MYRPRNEFGGTLGKLVFGQSGGGTGYLLSVELKGTVTETHTTEITEDGASITFENLPEGSKIYAEASVYENGSPDSILYSGKSETITISSGENQLALALKKIIFIGSKAPGKAKAVGDIVFSDGSATPYSEDLELTDEQKAAAVAVIFDAENKKGVGLFQNTGTLAFCVESATAYNDADNVYTPDESDGSVNLASIKALDDYSESNYPAFYYVDHYSDHVSSDLGTYANDWYIPAKNELMSIYNNKTTLDAAMELAGGAKFTANWYWSSNRRSEELKDNAAVLMFNNGSWNNYNKKSNGGGGYWCFVRKF